MLVSQHGKSCTSVIQKFPVIALLLQKFVHKFHIVWFHFVGIKARHSQDFFYRVIHRLLFADLNAADVYADIFVPSDVSQMSENGAYVYVLLKHKKLSIKQLT